jgi:hypothetical protein
MQVWPGKLHEDEKKLKLCKKSIRQVQIVCPMDGKYVGYFMVYKTLACIS